MSSGTKNVCVKLYKDVIHICGIDSNEMIPVISDIIMNMIHNARRMSIYCHEHNTEIDLLKGLGTGSIIIRGGKSVKISNLDPEVVSIIRYMKLAIPPEEFGSFIDWLVQGPFICEENLRILCAEKAMVNYNYNIGFRIIKPNVEEYLDGVDDFLCRYDPNSCFVTVSLPYTAEFKVIKKKKRTYHTFMLYNTGEVTQSGPNEELMAVAYEKFMHLVLRMRDKIMSGDKFTIPIPKYINSLSSPEDHESPKEGIEFDNEEF
jgi:hypothetical protein